jgi:hypothetical protein
MRKLSVLVLVPFLAACPAPEDETRTDPAEERVHEIGDTETVNISEVEDSGVRGDVRFTVLGENETDVLVEVRDARPNATYQVAVHQGTCDNPGAQQHTLDTIQTNEQGDGASTTTLNVRLANVMDGNHVVALHGPRSGDNGDATRDRDADRDADYDADRDADDQPRTDRADLPVACGEIGQAGTATGW